MSALQRGCSRYRPLLVDFVDRGEIAPGTGAALAHLDRCDVCTDAIESTMLTITALRRLGSEAEAVEPRADAWPRLRLWIETWRRPAASVLTSSVRGAALGLAIVAVAVIQLDLGVAQPMTPGPTVARPVDLALEVQIDRSRPIALETTSTPAAAARHTAWAGPDGLGIRLSTITRPAVRRGGSGGLA